MRGILLFFALITISSCGIINKPINVSVDSPSKTIWHEQEVNLIAGNMDSCFTAFNKAADYLYKNGVGLRINKDAKKSLVCIPGDPLLVRVLSLARAEGGAVVYGDMAYIKVTGDEEYDAKLMLHEMGHMFWGLGHTADGVMSFSNDLRALSSGYSDSTWAHIQNSAKARSSVAFVSYMPKEKSTSSRPIG